MYQSIINLWGTVKSWFDFSKLKTAINAEWLERVSKGSINFEDELPSARKPSGKPLHDFTYPHTIGPIVSLSKEEIDLIHQGKDASRRIVSAYYDYMGKFFMLFTGDGHSLMLPISFFNKNMLKMNPEKLRIIDHGSLISFGDSMHLATTTLLYSIQEIENRKNEKIRTRA